MEGVTALTTTIVIFGASGDLTERKLIPALFSLYHKKRLPDAFNIIGSARSPYSHEQFRDHLREMASEHESFDVSTWDSFAEHLWYQKGDVKSDTDYNDLKTLMHEIEKGPADRLYYLSVAPDLYVPIVEHLKRCDMAHEHDGWRRIVIEKPFGTDLASAKKLNRAVQSVFHEEQIYRIDHYLGKETSQNILFFRFANTIFEPIWNRNYIHQVQISVMEQVDVADRGAYYDQSGVLRDMFQNHLLQLLSLVAMEPPASFNADALRNEKVKVLSSIRPISDGLLAQYDGYQQVKGVASDSKTPTYAMLKLNVDNWRWQDVPFYLRSGKALSTKSSQIVIQFKCPPHMLFGMDDDFTPNLLSICIQPDEGIHLKFEAKVPGSIQETRSVDMEFHYRTSFGNVELPEAYERLFLDIMHGDATLFTRHDEIEKAWELIDPVIQGKTPVVTYQPGSAGPIEADLLLEREGRMWWSGCYHKEDQ
jgi:glucose-6-phosphate 1-dehydrogenase